MKSISALIGNAFLLALASTTLPDVCAADPLPSAMSGLWIVENPGARRAGGGDWSIRIDKTTADGSFEGKISFNGQNCHGVDMPMKGSYNGTDLVIEVPNLGACGASTATLKRTGGEHLFEGGMSHNPRIREYLDAK
ncbi:MAG: hypothetical protein E6H55_05260 [Betaproteobacteria bacterium]|nr:MAG: hypothetical protein E6H74_03175 [Betaproteobacteria bacterium]TMH08154.1 MAG: hypothetical protein E6H67_02040 [Betaproteobacteria bacterium]TMH63775.1 MAG: hypothetical protein E6H55_05260 [Betaproteobacteria bacterium]